MKTLKQKLNTCLDELNEHGKDEAKFPLTLSYAEITEMLHLIDVSDYMYEARAEKFRQARIRHRSKNS